MLGKVTQRVCTISARRLTALAKGLKGNRQGNGGESQLHVSLTELTEKIASREFHNFANPKSANSVLYTANSGTHRVFVLRKRKDDIKKRQFICLTAYFAKKIHFYLH